MLRFSVDMKSNQPWSDTLSYLEGTDEPKSEHPLVRVSSSGQGLLGV